MERQSRGVKSTRDLSPGSFDKRPRFYFLELRPWEAKGIDQSHMEPRTGLTDAGTLVPSSILDFIITGLLAVCFRTQGAHFIPLGNLVVLGNETMVGYADKCIFHLL